MFIVVDAMSLSPASLCTTAASAIEKGLTSLVQRAGGRDAAKIEQYIGAYGKDAHIAALEREKMDIHFAQGKMELGRFVCRKPA